MLGLSGTEERKNLLMNTNLDDTKPIQISENLWWVGFADEEAGFSNNPYLLMDEGEGLLFDPGPGHPIFRDLILQKIQQITEPETIKYIVVHHQDPDLCGLIPYLENFCHPDVVIIAHPRTALFLPYYGIRKNVLPVGDGDHLVLPSGKKISFIHTPYLHFAGNMFTYDPHRKNLFSSDVFAVFSNTWDLYADETYLPLARTFLEHYIADKQSLVYAYEKLKKMDIKQILPQHGAIIPEKLVGSFIELLKDCEPGKLLIELTQKPTAAQTELIIKEGINWFDMWLNKKIKAATVDQLLTFALEEGAAAVAMLTETLAAKALELGVANPLSLAREHKWDNIQSTSLSNLLESTRNRYLKVQYSMLYGDDKNVDKIITRRLQALKVNAVVMFIDIRGFSGWSYKKTADEVVAMLNKEHEIIIKIINTNKGRVNKILGDGVLAYFLTEHLDNSLEVACRIPRAIKEHGLLEVGVGLSYGEVILGDIGEDTRIDYTIIGSTVNMASRMCDTSGKNEVTISREFYTRLSEKNRETLSGYDSLKEVKVKIKKGDPESAAYTFNTAEGKNPDSTGELEELEEL